MSPSGIAATLTTERIAAAVAMMVDAVNWTMVSVSHTIELRRKIIKFPGKCIVRKIGGKMGSFIRKKDG